MNELLGALVRGPLMWVAALVFLGGMTYRVVQLFRLTRKTTRVPYPSHHVRKLSPAERKLQTIVYLQNTLLGQHPVMAIVALVFHACLAATALFSLAHNELLRQAWGISLFSFRDAVIDTMTILVLLGLLFFLVRRLAIPRVRAVSTFPDYLVLAITAAPFLTGFLAYRQGGDYETMILLHMLSGQLLLIAIPFTKLTHMVFFFFARVCFGSEFNLGRGMRTWST